MDVEVEVFGTRIELLHALSSKKLETRKLETLRYLISSKTTACKQPLSPSKQAPLLL